MVKRAFTLVELLVVVAIVVLLLAVLLPAMSKAVYQAALVSCGANQRGVVLGMLNYAGDNLRYYPYRGLPGANKDNVDLYIAASVLTHPINGEDGPRTYDVRKTLKKYVPINKQLNDPLTEAVNLEWMMDDPSFTYDTYILSSNFLWHGWRYAKRPDNEAMLKVGDRWLSRGPDTDSQQRFSLLVSDMDFEWSSNGLPVDASSHPDFKHMFNNIADHAAFSFGAAYGSPFITVSAWEYFNEPNHDNTTGKPRYPLDLNFTYEDGSVQRVSQIRHGNDDRMVRVSNRNDGAGWAQLPRP